ncbi:hypothetical protein, partial [Ilumatobacter sp.]
MNRGQRLGFYVVGIIGATWLASVLLSDVGVFPESWDIGLADPINDARRWLINNQRTHWLYNVILNPFSDVVEGVINLIETTL